MALSSGSSESGKTHTVLPLTHSGTQIQLVAIRSPPCSSEMQKGSIDMFNTPFSRFMKVSVRDKY